MPVRVCCSATSSRTDKSACPTKGCLVSSQLAGVSKYKSALPLGARDMLEYNACRHTNQRPCFAVNFYRTAEWGENETRTSRRGAPRR